MSRIFNIKHKLPKRITIVLALSVMVFCLALVFGKASQVNAACSPTTNYGSDTVSFTTQETSTYTIWVRMLAPSTAANQIMLDVDNGTCYSMGGSNAVAGSWTWLDNSAGTSTPLTISLNQGVHTLVLTGSEGGVGIDRVLFLGDSSCTPTGFGANCTPTPPTVSLTAPASGAVVSGSAVNISASATDAQGLSSVAFSVNGTAISTVTSSPYKISWNSTSVANGSATITATATDVDGLSASATEPVTVDNATTAPLSPPTGLVATAPAYNSVNLSWKASPSSGVTGYYILRGTGSNTPTSIASVGGSTLSYIDNTVDGSTSYTYEVVAFDITGNVSTPSTPATVTTPPSPLGSGPTVVITSPVNGATVSGTVNIESTVTDPGATITQVELEVGGKALCTLTAPSSKTSANSYDCTWDTTTYPQGAQTITVAAVDSQGQPGSDNVAVTVDNTTNYSPLPPTNVAAKATAYDSVVVGWTDSPAAGKTNSAASGYYVLRASGTNATTGFTTIGQTAANVTSYTDNTVAASTAYTYELEAFNSTNTLSAASNSSSVTTPANTTGGGGTKLYINAGGTAYTDASGNHWAADEYYTMDNTYGSSGGLTQGGDGSTCTTTTANSNCTTHAISVPAGDSQTTYQTERWGEFHYTIPVQNGNYNVVLKFAEINPKSGTRSEDVSIDGAAVLTNFGAGTAVGNYTADDKTFPVTVTNGSITITLTTVSNTASLSGIEVLPGTTSPTPTAPTNLSGKAVSPTQINLSWTASTGASGILYDVYENGSLAGSDISTTSYGLTQLTGGKTYTFYVVAYVGSQKSADSNTISVTTPIQATTTTLSGTVTSSKGTPLYARVKYDCSSGNFKGECSYAYTNSSGAYVITNIPPGERHISYSAVRSHYRHKNLTVNVIAGEDNVVNVTLTRR